MESHVLWIPVVAIIGFTVVLVTFFYLSHKNKSAIQETIKKSLDMGQELSPEILERLGTHHSPRVRDLRRGVVLMSLGVAGLVAGSMFVDPDDSMGFVAISMFPLFLGLGFLIVWKLNRYND